MVGIRARFVLVGAFLGASAVGGACSSSSTTPSPAPAATVPTKTDAGSTSPGSLYTRLGGHAGIRKAIDAIVAEELKDAEIAAYFANVGKPGRPTADQVSECFTNLLGKAAGGTETYPGMANGFACRDMKAAHLGLKITAAHFDKFVTIAAGVLKKAGVSDADIATIGGVLNGTKNDVVETTTLYSRLGGHAGIRSAVDAIVTEELKDAEIAAFFGDIGKPGHPTASQTAECFTNFLGAAAGGAEKYPGPAEGFDCRSMKDAHAGMGISSAVFDKFVTIAAGVLKKAGVSDADIATIGGVLNGTKKDVTGT